MFVLGISKLLLFLPVTIIIVFYKQKHMIFFLKRCDILIADYFIPLGYFILYLKEGQFKASEMLAKNMLLSVWWRINLFLNIMSSNHMRKCAFRVAILMNVFVSGNKN